MSFISWSRSTGDCMAAAYRILHSPAQPLRRSGRGLFLLSAASWVMYGCLLFAPVAALSAQKAPARRLELGKVIENELPGGATHSYELVLEAGQFVDVTAEQLGINVRVTLLKPDGKVIVAADSHRGVRGRERVCLIAEVEGRYALQIRSMLELAAPGKYRVTVTVLRPATAPDRTRLVAQELCAAGDRYRLKPDRDSWTQARQLYQQALAHWIAIDDQPRQAVTWRQISALSGRLNLGQEALDEADRALELYRALRDRSGEAHSLFTRGEALRWVWREPDRAQEHYQQALRICHEIGEQLIAGLLLQRLATLARERGEQQAALDYVQQSLLLLQATGERGDTAVSLKELFAIYQLLDDKPKALAALDLVRVLSRENGERKMEAEALIEIGQLHHARGETQKALDVYNEALAKYRAIADREGEARALLALGWLLNLLREKQQALDCLNQALAIHTALGDGGGQATVLKFLSTIYVSLGQMQKALEQSYRALQIWRELGNPKEEAAALFALGEVYRDLGDWQQALELSEQAAQRFHASGDRGREAYFLIYVGLAYRMLGEAQPALEHLNRAITLCQSLGARKDEAFALSQLAAVYAALRDREKAAAAHLRCIALCRVAGDHHLEAGALHNLGWLYFHHEDHQLAVEYHAQAAALYRKLGDPVGEANALRGLGRAYSALGQEQRGIDLLRQAIALAQASHEPAAEAIAHYGLALLHRRAGRLAEARANIEAALQLHESVRAKVSNRDLRATYRAATDEYYGLYLELLMRLHEQNKGQGYDVAAFQASENSRARTLMELLSEAGADLRQNVNPELVQREAKLREQINSALAALKKGESNRQVEAWLLDLKQLRDQIRVAHPRYAALTEAQPLSLSEIRQQVLDEDTLLLEYSLGQERSHLWVVTPTALHSFVLPKRAEIEAQARHVYNLLNGQQPAKSAETAEQWQARVNKAQQQFPAAAAQLSQTVLGPAASLLGTKRLLIIADGALQYIPFGALPVPEAEEQNEHHPHAAVGNPQSPTPLIVAHEIASLPSASTLAVLRRERAGRTAAPKSVAVLADPVFANCDERLQRLAKSPAAKCSSDNKSQSAKKDSAVASDLVRSAGETGWLDAQGNFRRLQHAKAEAEAIAKFAAGKAPKLALGFDASRALALSDELSQYRIVHFAAHGLLNSRHPELSGIVLSLFDRAGRAQNGFLRLHDIYNLKLSAELVVLSACQTALGQEISGEGLIGLTRGFMYAGAPRVVATLWSVDDRATAELIKRFYEGMLGPQQLRPAAALRAAQISMWRDRRWQQPYYWAAFVLQGEWR